MPLSVIELLIRRERSFDDACAYMKDECWGPVALKKLDDARQQMTGAFNAASAAAPDKKPQPLILDQEVINAIAALEPNKKVPPRPSAG